MEHSIFFRGSRTAVPAMLMVPLCLHLAGADALAQRGSLQGQVIDAERNPIEGVQVELELADGGGRSLTLQTDADGRFGRAGLRVGNYVVRMMLDGYQDVTVRAPVTSGEQSYLETVIMYELPPGMVSEKDARRAQLRADAFQTAMEAGDFAAAIEELKAFLEIVPDNANAHFNIAAAYEKLSDDDSALIHYQKAIDLEPEMYMAHLGIGDILGSRQEWQRAAEAHARARAIKDDDATVIYNYSVYAHNAQQMEKAVAGFKRVLLVEPDHAQAHFQLGLLLSGQSKTDVAADLLERYLELDPDGANVETARRVLDALKKGERR